MQEANANGFESLPHSLSELDAIIDAIFSTELWHNILKQHYARHRDSRWKPIDVGTSSMIQLFSCWKCLWSYVWIGWYAPPPELGTFYCAPVTTVRDQLSTLVATTEILNPTVHTKNQSSQCKKVSMADIVLLVCRGKRVFSQLKRPLDRAERAMHLQSTYWLLFVGCGG